MLKKAFLLNNISHSQHGSMSVKKNIVADALLNSYEKVSFQTADVTDLNVTSVPLGLMLCRLRDRRRYR